MLYFDEAGYTGADLTNKEQQFFTLASTNLIEDEIRYIKEGIGYEKWGKELHFKSMYSNPHGRDMLKKVFSHPLLNKDHIKLSYALKRYCIYAQIVDVLIETFYYEHGTNIYIGAKNLLLSNGLYDFAILHPNQDLIHEFEQNFVTMVRTSSVESIASFYRTTDKLLLNAETDDMFKELLSEIPQTIITIRDALNVSSFHMDLTIPLFSESIQKWYEEKGKIYDVVFDSSEPFFANLELLESLKAMEGKQSKVGYGDNKHVYPLPIGNLSIAKSHEEFGIQLADLYASALYFILTPRNDKYQIYQKELCEYPIFQKVEINIAPSSIKFIQKRMDDVEGIDPLDYICKHVKL